MVSAVYNAPGTALKFNGEAGADVAFSMEGVTDGAGRVSAQYDNGTGSQPFLFHWSCEVQWQATPTQYAALDLYLAEAPSSDSTQISGDQGASDAALGDVDAVRNMRFIGSVVSENAAASEKCVASGYFECRSRYFSIVGVNNGGAAINATDSNFVLTITPTYSEAQ